MRGLERLDKFTTKYRDDHVIMTYDDNVISESGDDHDEIEVLSSQIIYLEPAPIPAPSITEEKKRECEERREKERKRVSRVVAAISVILLVFCIILISISFSISGDIDEIVRNSNELLRKHSTQGTPIGNGPAIPETNFTGTPS